MRQLLLDLDGVMADMDGAYDHHFGYRLNRAVDEPPDIWDPVLAHYAKGRRFFYELPLMPDAMELWAGACRLHPAPAILTGVPHRLPQLAAQDKRDWVAKHFGPHVQVYTSLSKDKRTHGRPGDILVDDWPKYRHLWEEMGGIFVLHTSAAASLAELETLLGTTAE